MNLPGPIGPNARADQLEHPVPDYANPPYGARYGKTIKAFHRTGSHLVLGGMTPEDRDGTVLHPGRLGDNLTVEQGYAAARKAAINCLGMIRLATGSLDHVLGPVSALGFVAATPDFDRHHEVGEGVSDVLAEVFGEHGAVTRANVGVTGLARGNCFEVVLTVELKPHARRSI
ncbi:RidA family protein [Kineosporia sp. J2-2]|uniref:RidA family protein n=1 Tax=Kineosporia corallincola TaxID=2835133 RepID=A0ABS5TEC6_9ACTN|nr:RidA family protein [Kineosporia corallincola]MBT0769445.1 RidA family protein [Kineosporia corallincola]